MHFKHLLFGSKETNSLYFRNLSRSMTGRYCVRVRRMSLCSQIKMVWKFIKARGALEERWQMECLCLFEDQRRNEPRLTWALFVRDDHSTIRCRGNPRPLRLLRGLRVEGIRAGPGEPLTLWAETPLDSGIPPSLPWYQHSVFQPLYSDEYKMRRKEMRCQGKIHKNKKKNQKDV